ncbi:cytoskeleton protein RodZ [Vibrio sp. S11_S32]|uniref:cytoskeleton protein RodZ n=1 Tax=Vibrio sp. S11_S32 TaxID=2720225 RepID=UPI0016817E40|nr:cytoskeleton protein RodZ [Vibrio sp. S11_S32]MBD1576673.1 cytoskeleton protein RodZ [Vibrio sp. S11_S32]
MSTENKIEVEEITQHKLNTSLDTETLSAGEILRLRREELGLTQQDIAKRLRLKIAVIESIESHEFESHQVATFIRGYFRSYAKVVGVNEKDILKALELSGEGQHQHKEHSMQSFSQQTKKQKHDNHIMRLTWGILVVILGISSIWWWQNHQQDTLSAISIQHEQAEQAKLALEHPSTQENTAQTDGQLQEPTLAVSASEDAQTSTTPQPTDTTTTTGENASQHEATPVGTEQAPQISDAKESVSTEQTQIKNLSHDETANKPLAMTFKQDCWIQVKDSTGTILATGLKTSGQSITLTGKTPYSIILGAPEGVSITLADEPVDLSRYTAGKAARLTLL